MKEENTEIFGFSCS